MFSLVQLLDGDEGERIVSRMMEAAVISSRSDGPGRSTRFYTRRQAAERYGVHERTIDRWRKQGLLSFTTIGAGVLVRFTDQHFADFEARTTEAQRRADDEAQRIELLRSQRKQRRGRGSDS